MLAGGTGVVVLFGVVDEVLSREEATLGVARGQGLGHTGQHASALTGQHLLPAQVAPSASTVSVVHPVAACAKSPIGASCARRCRRWSPRGPRSGDARIDRGLDVVADHASALAAGRHGARVGIGQRDLAVGGGLDLPTHRLEDLHLFA